MKAPFVVGQLVKAIRNPKSGAYPPYLDLVCDPATAIFKITKVEEGPADYGWLVDVEVLRHSLNKGLAGQFETQHFDVTASSELRYQFRGYTAAWFAPINKEKQR